MFLDTLQALGTFFGGLGAFVAATTQLLTFLQKKNNEEEGSAGPIGDRGSPDMFPLAHPLCWAMAA